MSYHFESIYCFRLFILIAYMCIVFQSAVSQDSPEPPKTLIDTICDKTNFPDFCRSVFNSHHRSHEADINDLGLIIIDLAYRNASASVREISDVKKRIIRTEKFNIVGDMLRGLDDCNYKYQCVMLKMTRVSNWTCGWDVIKVRDAAIESMNLINDCRQQFLYAKIPLEIPSEETTNRLLHILATVCEVKMALILNE